MKLLKLIVTSLLVLTLLVSCNKEAKNETLPSEDFMVGTWSCSYRGLHKLVFDESSKVTIKANAVGGYKVGECDYLHEYKTSYRFDPKTKILTFEDDKLYMTKELNTVNSTCVVLNPPENRGKVGCTYDLTPELDVDAKEIKMDDFNCMETPVIFKKE